jgi:nucleotide-binding universal stress UspA family protein
MKRFGIGYCTFSLLRSLSGSRSALKQERSHLILFKNILVPLDGSKHSLKALEMAIQLAKKFDGKITLIYVYSTVVVSVMVPEGSLLILPEILRMTEIVRKAGSNILADGERRVKAEKIPVETILRESHTVQGIVKTVKEGNFDLVVIGARASAKIRDLLLGSVTDGVIHHVSCPVLVVK